ncbi:MAG: hypothetical protein PVI91_13435 [Gammaproteobacteria bacterium]|jgi:hypothetical protein
MIFDLFTLSGLILFVAMLAGLIATHSHDRNPSSGGMIFRDPKPRQQ